MKTISFAVAGLLLLGLTGCNQNAASKVQEEGTEEKKEAVTADAADNQGTPVFSFEEESHDFGTIKDGDKPQHTFTFTNTGDAPLIITNAKGSCGCTVPQWPREPIAPGETGSIDVVFDSSGKPGQQNKQVTLNANTVPNQKVLTISATVEPKDGEQAEAQEEQNS